MLGLTVWRRRMRGYGLALACNWVACSTLGYQNFPAIDLLTATVIAMFYYRRPVWQGKAMAGLFGAMLLSHAVFWILYERGVYWETYQPLLDCLFSVALVTVSLDGGRRVYDLARAWLSAGLRSRGVASAVSREKASP